jgi:RND superfamily putative drug exporter
MFSLLTRLVTARPWVVIGVWIVAAVVVVVASPSLASYTTSNNGAFLPSSYESAQAQEVASQQFPSQSGATGAIVVSRTDGKQLTSSEQSKVSALATSLTGDRIPGVTAVVVNPQFLSPNKKVYLMQVTFKGQPGATQVNSAVVAIRRDTDAFLKGTGLSGGLTGNAAIQVDTTKAYDTAETIIAIATVVLIVVLLGLVFRSPLIAVLPIVVIGLVHAVTTSLVADLADGLGFQVGPTLAPVLIVVLFGIGTDYIVFMLFRYRERLRLGGEMVADLRSGVSAVGVVVASAAVTVMSAFAALLLASLGTLRTLAPGLLVAVAVMLVAALTLVPALFRVLGNLLFWPHGVGHGKGSPRSERLGRHVGRRPGRYLLAYGLLLLALSCGALRYEPTYNTLAELPKDTPSLQAFDVMQSAFPPGALGPTQIYVVGGRPLTTSSLDNLDARLTKARGVSNVLPPQFTPDKDAAVLNVLLKANPYSTSAMNDVETSVRPAAHGSVPGDRVLAGGTTSQLVDVRAALNRDVSVVFPVALGIILLILALLLQAVVAPLYLLVGVGLSYIATLGVTVLVFIFGGGISGLDFSIPIVLYLFVVAIGTDYNILMSHRLREEFNARKPPHEAANTAISHGSPAVSTAALILAGTFLSLMLTGIASLTELGFGVAVGIVITAFAMATRLVPAIAALRGWRFWWPSKIHTRTAPGRAHRPEEALRAEPARR